MSSLRVVLDARALSHQQRGGFQSATRALVRGLGESTSDTEILLYLDRPLGRGVAKRIPSRFQIRVLSPDKLHSDFLLFRRQVKADTPDIVHGMMNYLPQMTTPTTVTIHDALGVKDYPFTRTPSRTARDWAVFWYSRVLTRRTAHTARRIATDSHASATELRGVFPDRSTGIQIVYPGVAIAAPTASDRETDSILVMASPDPRKNLQLLPPALLVAAIQSRIKPTVHIVCGSRRLAEAIPPSPDYRRKVHIAPGDKRLANLYARAAIFVFPSLYEGFGLPPLEAMTTGCAVAASSAPCLPETLGEAPLFFVPDSPMELGQAVARLLNNPDERRERGDAGRAWASRYTCRAYADAMSDFWVRALQP